MRGVSDEQHLPGADAAEEAGVPGGGAVAGLGFRDANGLNAVVLREVEDGGDVLLRADHVVLSPETEERRTLREVRDGVEGCEYDVLAEFLLDSLEVRDVDEDAVGEVAFAYRLACRSDVSSAEQKLLLLEDGEKYILRGRTSTPYEPYEEPVAEPAPADWPEQAHEWAVERFRELAPEFEAPGGTSPGGTRVG